MVEALAVASGKGGTGKTTATLALGMALADEYEVTVVDTDTGMANLLFHAGLADVDVTLHDLLVSDREATLEEATYDRFGMRIVPCGTSLEAFQAADPARLRGVIADLAADADVLLLDSPATLASRGAVLPVALADRIVLIVQPTIPAITDALKVQEYATAYGTGVAGVLFNKVHDPASVDRVVDRAGQYFEGPIVGTVPMDDAARAARRAGRPLLAHAPDSDAGEAYQAAAASIDVAVGEPGAFADRFRNAVLPDPP
ncbi:nucleotide-binding protein [Halanaeroarchaeum sulfurireducens]|uniref:Chromosome partitioning protein ParA n=1 Tax=Halanaeroarchaeum sulfurireducens TaxID=1604004 RepID=A0A0F7PA40_9EURY|nr:P-loop NTPase [Halanaeroarchaeum sulfurireducens]AKH97050.1 chromosome partitioning protein ParA [Halanaeroarchaeum sulfurireducens]ALG81451.1 chromosome partitioning protein ParA [Halanaeroarchaeum sulfurireducens]